MRTIVTPAAVLMVVLAAAQPAAAADDLVTPPQVPANLEVSEDNTVYLIGDAEGTQNYICLPSSTSPARFAWTLFGPQATLFDDANQQIITHFLSANPAEGGTPRATWQHSKDTSSVWGFAIASSVDPAYVEAGAIPWLLLRVVGAQYGPEFGDKLTPTTFIQRVNTSGGVAPATGCARSADVGKKALVPYRTDYIFYRAR